MVILEYITAFLYMLLVVLALILLIALAIPVGLLVGGYFLLFRRKTA